MAVCPNCNCECDNSYGYCRNCCAPIPCDSEKLPPFRLKAMRIADSFGGWITQVIVSTFVFGISFVGGAGLAAMPYFYGIQDENNVQIFAGGAFLAALCCFLVGRYVGPWLSYIAACIGPLLVIASFVAIPFAAVSPIPKAAYLEWTVILLLAASTGTEAFICGILYANNRRWYYPAAVALWAAAATAAVIWLEVRLPL